MFDFLRFILNWKQEQNVGKLSVINEVPGIGGRLLQKFLFIFLDCH